MAASLFTYINGTASIGDGNDPNSSANFSNTPMVSQQNIDNYVYSSMVLDSGETITPGLLNYDATAWSGLVIRVVGEIKLTTVGVNWDLSTSITGVTLGYGVEQYPGMISMTSTRISTFTIESLADGTSIEYLFATLLTDASL